MANDLSAVIPRLLAQGLMALRERAITVRLINRAYESLAGQKGSSIDVPIPSAIPVRSVTPAVSQPANQESNPTFVSIQLDQWWEAPFYLSDKDMLEAVNGIMPMQASEAVKSLANKIDTYMLGFYLGVYNQAGAAGTTPFASDISAYINARKRLNTTLAPMDDRRVLLDPAAEANALKLNIFLAADQRGDQGGVIEGNIGRKLGADWYLNQNIPTHTAGSASGAMTVSATATAGATSVSIAAVTPTAGTFLVGDLLLIGTNHHVVSATATATSGVATVSISPAVPTGGYAAGATVAMAASHVVNMLFHRDAFAFATRPLEGSAQGLGNIIASAVDPVSGLSLRLEVSRQYKQTTFSYDILCGGQLIRPELACRILG